MIARLCVLGPSSQTSSLMSEMSLNANQRRATQESSKSQMQIKRAKSNFLFITLKGVRIEESASQRYLMQNYHNYCLPRNNYAIHPITRPIHPMVCQNTHARTQKGIRENPPNTIAKAPGAQIIRSPLSFSY